MTIPAAPVIYVVDDDASVRKSLTRVIGSAGHAVEAFASAREFLDRDASPGPGCLIVDVRMPDSDGLELLHQMKERWPDTPVIMLTSFDHAQYVRRALAEGAAGYMLKDATPEDLEQAIKVAISGGGNVLSPRVIQNLFESIDGPGRGENGDKGHRPIASLTKRSASAGPSQRSPLTHLPFSRSL